MSAYDSSVDQLVCCSLLSKRRSRWAIRSVSFCNWATVYCAENLNLRAGCPAGGLPRLLKKIPVHADFQGQAVLFRNQFRKGETIHHRSAIGKIDADHQFLQPSGAVLQFLQKHLGSFPQGALLPGRGRCSPADFGAARCDGSGPPFLQGLCQFHGGILLVIFYGYHYSHGGLVWQEMKIKRPPKRTL